MSAIPTPPEAAGDERGALLGYLDAQRSSIRRSVYGLTEEQARSKPSASDLSLAGLLKHVAHGEAGWLRTALGGEAPDYNDPAVLARADEEFKPTEEETVESLLAFYSSAAKDTERAVRELDSLDETFTLPSAPWDKGGPRSWRWALLHLIEEVARHSGHADIIRESLDGKSAVDLMIEAGDMTLDWDG